MEPSLDDLKAQVKDILGEFKKANYQSLAEGYGATQVDPAVPVQAYSVEWRLVDLARDLCRAAGHDPDLRVLDTQNVQRGPLGSTPVSMSVPAWTLYIEAAQNVRGALNG